MAVNEVKMIGDKSDEYGPANPHPGHGVDENIMNEYGHTHYPKYVHKFDDKGKIMVEVVKGMMANDKGIQYETIMERIYASKIVKDEEEEDEANAEGYFYKWEKPKTEKKATAKPPGDWKQ